MSVLATGLLLWVVVHLFPSLLPEQRQKLISRIGDKAYQGIFALCILAGLLLIVFGWRSAIPTPIYTLPSCPPFKTPTTPVWATPVCTSMPKDFK